VRFCLVFVFGALALDAQLPRIGNVDLYGVRRVPREKILRELKLSEGDRLPASKAAVEERLEQIPDVVTARIAAVCCENGTVSLFVGIEEKGAAHFALRSAPGGEAVLPEEIVESYRAVVRAMEEAGRHGRLQQDLTKGHALMADPDGRALQEKFTVDAKERLKLIREVLRDSANDEHRAIAATVIGYAPRKSGVIDDLLYAMQDPDETVRANAIRSLEAIAVLARLRPELELSVSPTWFIEMLNSVSLSDRYRAATALVTLTEQDGAKTLEHIRERAWESVVEMARWKNLRYAVPSFLLLGRMAGMTREAIEKAWSSADRIATVDAIAARQH
jgi:hypothetical protein